jgi:hypothetical protein
MDARFCPNCDKPMELALTLTTDFIFVCRQCKCGACFPVPTSKRANDQRQHDRYDGTQMKTIEDMVNQALRGN